MDLEHFEMIGGMVVLTVVIIAAIQFQVSQMEGLGDVSGDWITGEGTKAASSFHLANRDGQIGSISADTKDSISGGESNGCNADIPGLESTQDFKFNWSESNECGDLSKRVTRVKIPLRVEESSSLDTDYFNVGAEGSYQRYR